jgi:hypothetical protein
VSVKGLTQSLEGNCGAIERRSSGIKFCQQVAVAQSVQFARGLRATEIVFVFFIEIANYFDFPASMKIRLEKWIFVVYPIFFCN